jgi:hypothetical protein
MSTETSTPLPMRGEGSVTLCGEDHKLRATFRALTAIEERCKKDILTLLREIADSRISVTVVAGMLYELQRAAGGTLTAAQAGDLLIKSGLTEATIAIVTLLSTAITSGDGAAPTTDPS